MPIMRKMNLINVHLWTYLGILTLKRLCKGLIQRPHSRMPYIMQINITYFASSLSNCIRNGCGTAKLSSTPEITGVLWLIWVGPNSN